MIRSTRRVDAMSLLMAEWTVAAEGLNSRFATTSDANRRIARKTRQPADSLSQEWPCQFFKWTSSGTKFEKGERAREGQRGEGGGGYTRGS